MCFLVYFIFSSFLPGPSFVLAGSSISNLSVFALIFSYFMFTSLSFISHSPGILWIIALLSSLLTSDTVFRGDFEDGSLEQLLLAPQPLFMSVLAYILAHWLITGLLLALMSPLFALMIKLPAGAIGALMASLLLGTAVLSLVGGIGAALTVGLKRGGMLISLLILPFYMPVLIFGSAAVQNAVIGVSAAPYLAILGAMLCLAIALAPFAIAAGLRISVDA